MATCKIIRVFSFIVLANLTWIVVQSEFDLDNDEKIESYIEGFDKYCKLMRDMRREKGEDSVEYVGLLAKKLALGVELRISMCLEEAYEQLGDKAAVVRDEFNFLCLQEAISKVLCSKAEDGLRTRQYSDEALNTNYRSACALYTVSKGQRKSYGHGLQYCDPEVVNGAIKDAAKDTPKLLANRAKEYDAERRLGEINYHAGRKVEWGESEWEVAVQTLDKATRTVINKLLQPGSNNKAHQLGNYSGDDEERLKLAKWLMEKLFDQDMGGQIDKALDKAPDSALERMFDVDIRLEIEKATKKLVKRKTKGNIFGNIFKCFGSPSQDKKRELLSKIPFVIDSAKEAEISRQAKIKVIKRKRKAIDKAQELRLKREEAIEDMILEDRLRARPRALAIPGK